MASNIPTKAPHTQVKSYDLFFDIDFRNLKFEGITIIDLESEGDVVLDCLNLRVGSVEANGTPIGFSQSKDKLQVETGPISNPLRINYSGSISDELVGLYRAAYGNAYVLTTQFEASHARRLFPCVDHPNFKAEFKVTLRIDKDLDAISNMPEESVTTDGEKKTVTFQRTPRMSTYLLYLGIGHFEEIRDKLGQLDIIAAATPGKAEGGRFALNVAKRSLDFYGSYFNIPFSLPKIHLVSVPEFAHGAMENWGAISFRETALLVQRNSSVRTQKRVALVVAHELAHMWFGDLVTFRWWNDLWLNESFATFMEYKVVDSAFPQWRMWEDFLRDETTSAMTRDSLENTHPIEVDVRSPDEIEELFDEISYEKGANIIRMIEDFVGADDFKAGIRTYIGRFRLSNASGDDLWNCLEGASEKHVAKVIGAWIRKPGYPVLTVGLEGGKLVLRQERFLLSGSSHKDEGPWPIPVTLRLNGEKRRLLMEGEEKQIEVEGVHSVLVNTGRAGFYRVLYQGLYDLAWRAEPSSLDQWGIISDAFAFLLSGRMPLRDYLGLLDRYQGTKELLPAQEVSNQLSLLYQIIPSTIKVTSAGFHSSQLEILKSKEDENSIMFRGVVARRLSMVDDEYARELGSRLTHFGEVEPNMKEAVAVAYARTNDDFDLVLKMYREGLSDEEKVWMINSLVSFKDPELAGRSLQLALGGEVKRQDVFTLIMAAAGNPDARQVLWDWIKAHMEKLREIYRGTNVLARILSAAIPIIGIGRREEFESFFQKNPVPEAESGIQAGLEKLRVYDRLACGEGK